MSITKFNTSATPAPSTGSSGGIITLFVVLAISAVVAYFYLTKDKDKEKSSADSETESQAE